MPGYGQAEDGREYDADEVEFMLAMHAYQAKYGKRFPTFSEALMVAKSLGYRKAAVEEEQSDAGRAGAR